MLDVITSTATIVSPGFNSAVNNLLRDVLQLVLLGLGSLAATAIARWKSSLNSKWKQAIAERAVKFVQQRYVDNEEKQKQAAAVIASHFPRMNPDEVQHLIEEAVFNMKTQMNAPAVATAAVVVPAPVATEEKPQ
jgi:hypothetical protein